MRRFRSLVRSAVLETLAEPLSAVLFLVALLTIPLLPAFHCHQFGEAGRLPRECGFSALLVFGIAFATSSAVRVVGGELASGTASAALARDVSRPLFFCAKVVGVLAAFALFVVAVGLSTLASVATAEMGLVQERLGHLLAQVPVLVFVAMLASVPMHLALLPALGVLAVGCCVFIVLAGALAVRLPPAAVTTGVAMAVLSSFVWPVRAVLPDIERFWLVDCFSYGGVPTCGQLVAPLAVGTLLVVFWLIVGSVLLERREIS